MRASNELLLGCVQASCSYEFASVRILCVASPRATNSDQFIEWLLIGRRAPHTLFRCHRHVHSQRHLSRTGCSYILLRYYDFRMASCCTNTDPIPPFSLLYEQLFLVDAPALSLIWGCPWLTHTASSSLHCLLLPSLPMSFFNAHMFTIGCSYVFSVLGKYRPTAINCCLCMRHFVVGVFHRNTNPIAFVANCPLFQPF